MYSAHQVTREFEKALCEYTGAPYAVAVTSCTMALTLAVAWCLRPPVSTDMAWLAKVKAGSAWDVEIPKRTYVGVPYAIREAGGRPTFREEEWRGRYQLKPLPVWDAARLFTSGMADACVPGTMQCVSFHWSKTLGIQQGGAILHDDPQADAWLRRARFDGRSEGVAPKDDAFPLRRAWHCYMSPEVAAEGLMRLSLLPKHNDPLPNDEYPDLSQIEVFK